MTTKYVYKNNQMFAYLKFVCFQKQNYLSYACNLNAQKTNI